MHNATVIKENVTGGTKKQFSKTPVLKQRFGMQTPLKTI